MFSKRTLITVAMFGAILITGCATKNLISEESLGLRKTDIYTEKTTVGELTTYTKVAAGEAKVYKRAYENAPPMIPHDIEGLVPITTDNNSCLGCHDPMVASSIGATSVPKSHMYDMRKHTVLDTVSNARYNCTQCHVPQSNNEPLVKNTFQPDFLSKESMHKSNLLKVLNEGVK